MGCRHRHIDVCDEHHDGLHEEGWCCLDCGAPISGPCHLESDCRRGFCGADPIPAEERATPPAATV